MKQRILLALTVLAAFWAGAQALTSAPAWVAGITPGTWQAVSLNTPADVDPEDDPAVNPNYPSSAPWHGTNGQKCVIDCWNGGVFAPGLGAHGSLLLYGGGHAGYRGSEVYAFDMDSLKWERITDPYPGPYNWPYEDAAYPDGSAIPPHTYDYVNYHPATNSFVLLRGVTELGPPSNGVTVGIMHMLNLTTLEWRHSPKNSGDNLYSGGYSVYDPVRDVFWVEGGSGGTAFVRYDPNGLNADGTYGSFQNYSRKLTMTDSQAELEPNKDLFVVTAFRNDTVVYAVDLTDPASNRVKLKEGGAFPNKEKGHGWEWSDSRQSIVYWRRGPDVYEFIPPAGDWRTDTWTWNKITAASNAQVPQEMSTDNGVYSRFRIAKYADAEVAVVIMRIDGPVYAFRIPDGPTALEGVAPLAARMHISARPNPFRSVVNLKVSGLAGAGRGVSLKVFDPRGRQVENLTSRLAGSRIIRWDASRLPEGVYAVRLACGSARITRKIILVK